MIAARRGSRLREIGWEERDGISTLDHRENQPIVSQTMGKIGWKRILTCTGERDGYCG